MNWLYKAFDSNRSLLRVSDITPWFGYEVDISKSETNIDAATNYYEINHLISNSNKTDLIITISDDTGFTVTIEKTGYADTAQGSSEWIDVTDALISDETTSWEGTAAERKCITFEGKWRWVIKIVNQSAVNTTSYEGKQYIR